MMPDDRMLQDVMPSTMHMMRNGFAGLQHVLVLPKAHASVPKHSCIQAGRIYRWVYCDGPG